jgi:muconolactone delta-isomerase
LDDVENHWNKTVGEKESGVQAPGNWFWRRPGSYRNVELMELRKEEDEENKKKKKRTKEKKKKNKRK